MYEGMSRCFVQSARCQGGNREPIQCCFVLACEDYGGLLIDHEGEKMYVPEFNSAVVFRVPRFHQVTPVKTHLPRYSLFGWWLVKGEKYTLNLTPNQDKEEGEEEPRRLKRPAAPLSYSIFGHSNSKKLWRLRQARLTETSHKR